MTKELCLEESLGQRRAVDGDERGSAAWTPGVNQARHDLLPRPLSPVIALWRHTCGVRDLFLEIEDGWTRANEFRGISALVSNDGSRFYSALLAELSR